MTSQQLVHTFTANLALVTPLVACTKQQHSGLWPLNVFPTEMVSLTSNTLIILSPPYTKAKHTYVYRPVNRELSTYLLKAEERGHILSRGLPCLSPSAGPPVGPGRSTHTPWCVASAPATPACSWRCDSDSSILWRPWGGWPGIPSLWHLHCSTPGKSGESKPGTSSHIQVFFTRVIAADIDMEVE